MTINLLPEDIVNQIAAGEVIENPSAVIKELVENSIDANSTQIDIEIEDYGLKKIIIKDNGDGIFKDDLKKAPLRHATSKIKNFEDLYNIKTMGFRGEALASVFSISNAKIISKQKNSNESYEINSNHLDEIKISASSFGTTIIIEDLFYNTPARKKYLKSNNLELKSIIDIIDRFQIYHNNIKFTLKHNSKILVNKPIFKTKQDNLYYILGKELKDNLIYFENQIQGIKISGFLGKPNNISYAYKKNQYIYVNSRYIKSKLISDSIYEAFSTNLMSGRHPFFVIFIEIDPEVIDVNVHPTKIEIRFENELEIYEFVKNSVKQVFEKNEFLKPFEQKQKNYSLDEVIEDIPINVKKYPKQQETISNYTKDTQKMFDVKEEIVSYSKPSISVENYDYLNENKIEYGSLYVILNDYKIIGQVNKTFIILETKSEMIILDQHVVEEKFYYESIKQLIENKKPKTQKLLSSKQINFSQSEMLSYKENKDLFEKLGFVIDEFSNNSILVRETPIGLNNLELSPDLIKDIIGEISIDKKFKLLEQKTLEKIASMSCKKSLKAGTELTNYQIQKMIENLKTLKEPWSCPHGRPIMLRYTFKDLEKNFKRII